MPTLAHSPTQTRAKSLSDVIAQQDLISIKLDQIHTSSAQVADHVSALQSDTAGIAQKVASVSLTTDQLRQEFSQVSNRLDEILSLLSQTPTPLTDNKAASDIKPLNASNRSPALKGNEESACSVRFPL